MEKDHLEILLEDIRGKFDLVLEGHEVLRKEIQDTRQELTEKIDFVDFKVEALNRKVDFVDSKVEVLNRKVDFVDSKVEVLNRKVDDVRDELNRKVDSIAVDLAAHRADTESHRPVYRVKE